MIKKALILTLIFSLAFPVSTYTGRFSPETTRLMKEAGLLKSECTESELQAQEAKKRNQANNSTLNSKTSLKSSNSSLDELHINKASQSTVSGNVKVTNTDDNDELHIYSDDYTGATDYGTKMSYDEFRVNGEETPANDGYDTEGFDELHIPTQYRQNVWQPDHPVQRLGIDEFRLPNEMN